MKPLFAVLPYVQTEKPLHLMGLTLRSSKDTEGLSSEEADHLNNISSMFFLSEDKPLDQMIYIRLLLPDDRDRANRLVSQLRAVHTVLTFILTAREYDTYEQMSIYAALPTEVFLELSTGFVPGYALTLNWLHYMETTKDKKLYPPLPYPLVFIPHGGDLSDLQFQIELDRARLAGLDDFIRGRLLHEPEQASRFDAILRAMSWYNRSFSEFVPPQEKIVDVAVAFETLFHRQESDQRIANEIKTYLRGLFGDAPRLNLWVDQFYQERSRILHEGFSTQLSFIIGDKRPAEQQLVMDSLINYGRRLLRMCIWNILHGTLLAEEANLNAWFTHDKERLQEMCRLLRQESVSAEQRLLSVIGPVYDLGDTWVHHAHYREIDIQTLHAAGKALIKTFLEAYPETEVPTRQFLERIAGMEATSAREVVDSYSAFVNQFGKGFGTYKDKYWPREPFQMLLQFAKYAGSHHFVLR